MQISEAIKGLMTGDGRTATVAKNVIASFAIKGVSIIVSFALVPLTIGYVSSELYGVWLTLSSVLTWLSFLDIGFSQGLKNKLTEAIANDDWEKGKSLVSTTYFMMLLIFIPVCLLLEIIIPMINWCSLLNVGYQFQEELIAVIRVLVAFACLQMVVNVFVYVVAAFQKVALSNTFVVLGNLISLFIIYFLSKTTPPSLIALALSLAAMPILVTILASYILYSSRFRKVAPSFLSINCKYVKDLFSLGYKFFIINIQSVVLYQSTNILISNVSSPNYVTTYNIAYKLLSVAMMAYYIITTPLWPAYTDAYTRKDFNWMINMRGQMHKILVISIIGCIATGIMSPFIYNLWIGESVHVPYEMTAIVCLYIIIVCWSTLNGTLLTGMGKVKLSSYIVVVGMFVHIPLSLFLSKFIGCYGVIGSMSLITLMYSIVFNIQINKIFSQKAIGIWNE